MTKNCSLQDTLMTLIRICEELALGHYDHIEGLFELVKKDECPQGIAKLVESIGMMTVKIEAREMMLKNANEDLEKSRRELEKAKEHLAKENLQLKSEIKDLYIEIDQHQKKKDVMKITRTSYFKSLQQKAQQMRNRIG